MQVTGFTYTRIHPWPNEVRVGSLCWPSMVWESFWETSPHATRQGTLVQSSQLAEPLAWSWPKRWTGVCELISTSKKSAGRESLNFFPKSSQVRKKAIMFGLKIRWLIFIPKSLSLSLSLGRWSPDTVAYTDGQDRAGLRQYGLTKSPYGAWYLSDSVLYQGRNVAWYFSLNMAGDSSRAWKKKLFQGWHALM